MGCIPGVRAGCQTGRVGVLGLIVAGCFLGRQGRLLCELICEKKGAWGTAPGMVQIKYN